LARVGGAGFASKRSVDCSPDLGFERERARKRREDREHASERSLSLFSSMGRAHATAYRAQAALVEGLRAIIGIDARRHLLLRISWRTTSDRIATPRNVRTTVTRSRYRHGFPMHELGREILLCGRNVIDTASRIIWSSGA
jgi:hypothetical protein